MLDVNISEFGDDDSFHTYSESPNFGSVFLSFRWICFILVEDYGLVSSIVVFR
jgi:hypothetical protein